MYRTHTNGQLRLSDINKKVKLVGWVAKKRNFGSIVFIDLRDRYGITQLVINQNFEEIANKIKNEFIIIQFLTESVLLSVLGGIIGLLITFGFSMLLNVIIESQFESNFRLLVTKENVLIGLAFSTVIGLLSGFIPAYKAGQLQPVEAMRSK